MPCEIDLNLFSLLQSAALRFPELGAVYLGQLRIRTFSELERSALRLAAGFRRRYEIGSRIAIVSENCPEYVELMFAAWAAGLVIVPLNSKLHAREIIEIIEDCKTSLALLDVKRTAELVKHIGNERRIVCDIVALASPEFQTLYQISDSSYEELSADALAWLFYTSGTTGKSKGAMLSHRNLMAMTTAHLADVEGVDEHCSLIHAAPMSHGSGLYILPYLAKGCRQVVPASRSFDPNEFLQLCGVHSLCSAFLAPTMVRRLREAVGAETGIPAGLRTIIYGGGPMYVEEMRKSIDVLGHVFVQIYGQGESPMTITSLRRSDHATSDDSIIGSVGWARTGMEVAVFDVGGARVNVDVTGEVACRGETVMMGYWNNGPATREAIRNGWLYTGDLGSFDKKGYLTLRDRSKDVIISGGSNIYPREVEEALLGHPGVAEVCVVGQRDIEWGEVVVAFVVLAAGAGLHREDLDRHCLDRIARFKRPKRYQFVESLPKNNYGKVLRRDLRDLLPTLAADGPSAQLMPESSDDR